MPSPNTSGLLLTLLLLPFFFVGQATDQKQWDSIVVAVEKTAREKGVAVAVDIYVEAVWTYINQSDSTALYLADKSLKLSREHGYSLGVAKSLEIEGLYYEIVKGDLEKASQRYFEAVEICETNNLDYLADLYHIIGVMFHTNDHYEKAKRYYELALEYARPEKHTELQKKCFINLGNIHSSFGAYDQAEVLFQKSVDLEIAPWMDFNTYANWGNLYIRQNEYKKAIPYLEKATERHPDNPESENNLRFLIDAKAQLKDTTGMTEVLQRAKASLDNNANLREKSLMARSISDYYKEIGDFEKALTFRDDYIQLYEEILEKRNNDVVLDLEARYKTEKANATIAQQNLRIEKESTQRKRYLILGIFLLVLCVVSTVFLRSIWIHRERLKKEMALKEKALEENQLLFREMHHRTKNNLQLLNSLLGLQSRNMMSPDAQKALQSSRDTVGAISLLHHQLYKTQNLKEVPFAPYISELCEYFAQAFALKERNILLKHHCDDFNIDMDKAVPLGLIINELITNAIKHAFKNSEQGTIQLEVTRHNNSVNVLVEDNGTGAKENPGKPNGTGTKLIQLFSNRFEADFEWDSQPTGTSARFSMPA